MHLGVDDRRQSVYLDSDAASRDRRRQFHRCMYGSWAQNMVSYATTRMLATGGQEPSTLLVTYPELVMPSVRQYDLNAREGKVGDKRSTTASKIIASKGPATVEEKGEEKTGGSTQTASPNI